MASVNAGPRLDRLPISRFHRRVFALVGIGMFLDGFDIYLAGTILGATIQSGFATIDQAALFVSSTFIGMMLGSVAAGFIGDRYGRAFTYQINLAIFGLASIAAGLSPNMTTLIVMRFFMGLGLGAENVVGFATLSEFIPAHSRGRWLGITAMLVSLGLPVSIMLSTYLIPGHGWRIMFFIGGVSGLLVWWIRKVLPESPRWLESIGRVREAETLLEQVESEATEALPPLPAIEEAPPPSRALSILFRPPLLRRMIVGSLTLILVNAVIQGFVTWLPTFFIRQGMSLVTAFKFALVMSIGAPVGGLIAAFLSDKLGRKPTVALACAVGIVVGFYYPQVKDPALLPLMGLALTAPVFVLMALLFGIYIPELFPTEVRLRAAGICNMLGRGVTVFTPFVIISLFDSRGIDGVTTAMAGLLAAVGVVVVVFGVEPRNRSLEELTAGVSKPVEQG